MFERCMRYLFAISRSREFRDEPAVKSDDLANIIYIYSDKTDTAFFETQSFLFLQCFDTVGWVI